MFKFWKQSRPHTDYKTAKFAVIPVPYEKTTSYGKGTINGPAAILKASEQVEDYDIELDRETFRAGINVGRAVRSLEKLTEAVTKVLNDKKIPVVLGGEHSITPYSVAACKKKYKDLSVLQLDAHSDLRNTYHGSRNSHACAMRRVLEICPAVQAGIRSMDISEMEFARSTGQIAKIHFAEKLEIVEKINSQLSKDVYITIDIDVLDPSIMPATGTPEPGGLDYYEVLDILKGVAAQKNIVGFDLVELAPIKGLNHPDFTAAKLIYKLMGYISSKPL
jgi:agmatinase